MQVTVKCLPFQIPTLPELLLYPGDTVQLSYPGGGIWVFKHPPQYQLIDIHDLIDSNNDSAVWREANNTRGSSQIARKHSYITNEIAHA